ncbi:MAG: ACT domain-containing protein [Actinobacteria bacterium]|nr:ACT domain-containing protein [Actinomycetota bacterium]
MSATGLYAVTVIGNDRSGIVAGVTKALYDTGCNLEDATSTILRGHFSMMLIVSSDADAGRLRSALTDVAGDLGVTITVAPVEEAALEVDAPTHMVSVYGADHPGIVFRISQALADAGANVTDMTSRIIGSSDEPVYALMLEVAAAADADLEEKLAGIASEIGVDVSVHPIEADIL